MYDFLRIAATFALFCMVFLTNGQSDPLKAASKEKERIEKAWAHRDKQVDKVVNQAISLIGTPYKVGGTNKKGLDEDHFAVVVYKSVGVELPNSMDGQALKGERKYIGEIKKGDMLFFALSEGSKKLSSVGVVTNIIGGDVYFVQCTSLTGVKQQKLNDPKWKSRYVKASRLIMEPS